MAHYSISYSNENGKVKTREITPWRLFHDFISQYISTLIERGFIQVGEYYKSHITPRYDDKPQYGREIVYIETPERTWLEDDGRPGWRSEQQRSGAPLRYFTLTLCTSPRGLVYRKDFPLSVLDRTIAERLKEADPSLSSTYIQQGQDWSVVALGQESGPLPDLSPNAQASDSFSLVILASPSYLSEDTMLREPLSISIESITDGVGSTTGDPNQEQESLEISLESVEVDLPTKPPVAGPRQVEGIKFAGDLNILIARSTLEKITQESISRPEGEITGGGLLIGEAFKEETSGELVTYITDCISASRVIGGSTGAFWFTAVTWDAMLRLKEQHYRDAQIVGWYRDHLVGNWLSSDDEWLHNNFFKEPWHVALILDRMRGSRQFYHWKGDGQLVPSTFFDIIN